MLDLAQRYVSLRYGGNAEQDALPAFKDAVRAFKPKNRLATDEHR
jgi:hypothetical protein